MFKKFIVGLILVTAVGSVDAAQQKLNVVATTTFNADLVRQIGGDRVSVKHVAAPQFDVHFIEPKPSDVKNLKRADLYVHSGLDLESWSDPLTEAAGKPELFRGAARSVDLSEGIHLLNAPAPDAVMSREHGDLHLFGNPHYHLNPENAILMSRTLLRKLIEADPDGAEAYRNRQAQWESRLTEKIASWKAAYAHLSGKRVYAYHDEVDYLAEFLGIQSGKYLEPKPGIPPTPKHLAALERHAKTETISAILQTTYCPKPASQALSGRLNIPVVTIAHNVNEVAEASDIVALYEYDLKQIAEALNSNA